MMDVDLAILVERAAGYDPRFELFGQVWEATARTSMEDKIQALGQILADGLRSDSHLEEALMLASMVNDLEAPHVVVLKLIAEQPVPPESMWSNPGGPRGWERTHLALALPDYNGLLGGVLAALVRHGALRTLGDATWDGVVNNHTHGITTLGTRCLQLFDHETVDSPHAPRRTRLIRTLGPGNMRDRRPGLPAVFSSRWSWPPARTRRSTRLARVRSNTSRSRSALNG
ncbi:hypothetical protein BS329_18075 [Amycolatopsis coloradensis]|uniref:Uncharacterized protein n=1 Tax=Amycolatopsis coloradensis TaxID=76021 RepID=A0A1R0KT42_9PSEU|nr:hypothetical protein [Amycolatopsis coloradensis]OLZ51148.1 hypothetical protein BS329_18075 [Amycolatopsis coloradensis]